jgi:hypothetical protein
LTAKDYKGNSKANHNKLRNQCVDESKNIHSNDDVKKNGGGKQDLNQDCSMDTSSDGKLNIQHDVMTGGEFGRLHRCK